MNAWLSIEVCYACAEAQTLIALRLAAGATIRQAIDASGIVAQHPDIDLTTAQVGIFGKITSLDTLLVDFDRVEIYRPLVVDPKLARQLRVDKIRREGSIEGRKWRAKDSR